MNGSADRFEPEDLNVADAAIRSPDPDGFSVMLDGLGDAPVAGVGNGGGGRNAIRARHGLTGDYGGGARVLRKVLVTLVVATVALCMGGWSCFQWWSHWRRIPVNVNGETRMVRVDATLGELAKSTGNFGAKPGRLLSLSGRVLDKVGGGPVRYSLNGHLISISDGSADGAKNAGKDVENTARSRPVANRDSGRQASMAIPDSLYSMNLTENATITAENGKDVTEGHDVKRAEIPYGVAMNGHGVIQKLRKQGKPGVSEAWTGKISGEKVDKGIVEQPQDVVVDTFSPQPSGRKVIALTFDDGPSKFSGSILDELKAKNVKATFFDVGRNAAGQPQMEQRMVAEGHQVASHSNTHPDMKRLNTNDLRTDIIQGFANIRAASGVTTKVVRAPYGNFGAEQWREVSDLVDANVIWTIDTADWKLPGAQSIRDAVLSKASNGAVVLMHDGGGDRSEDVQALPSIIDGLKAQGFEFVTIDELIAMNGR